MYVCSLIVRSYAHGYVCVCRMCGVYGFLCTDAHVYRTAVCSCAVGR